MFASAGLSSRRTHFSWSRLFAAMSGRNSMTLSRHQAASPRRRTVAVQHRELQPAFSILRHGGQIWLVYPEGCVNFWRQRRHRFFGARRSSLSKNRSCLLTPPRTGRRHGADLVCIRLIGRFSPALRPPYQPPHPKPSPPPRASHPWGFQRSLATPSALGRPTMTSFEAKRPNKERHRAVEFAQWSTRDKRRHRFRSEQPTAPTSRLPGCKQQRCGRSSVRTVPLARLPRAP